MKRKSNQSDFKRLKAKVGKRAPKALNATDTSFRTSSLHIGKQKIDDNNRSNIDQKSNHDLTLISSRGKTLAQLLSTIDHHSSPSIRTASIHGIQDAIQNSNTSAVQAHLTFLIPALSKAIIDEDPAVRSLAITVLLQVFQMTTLNSTRDDIDSHAIIRPFLPLHSAYLSSALNSLDPAVRMDGVKMAETTFSYFPSIMKGKVSTILPAYARLLSYLSTSSTNTNGTMSELSSRNDHNSMKKKNRQKKKKKNKSKDSAKDYHHKAIIQLSRKDLNRSIILKSLLSLLRTCDIQSIGLNDSFTNTIHLNPAKNPFHFTFVPGGVASNAILLPKPYTCQQPLFHVSTCHDFPSLFLHLNNDQQNKYVQKSEIKQTKPCKPTIQERIDLLLQLRDCWIEVTQCGETYKKNGEGIALNDIYMEQALLIVHNMRYFWNHYCRSFHMIPSINSSKARKIHDKESKEPLQIIKSTTRTILTMFQETFPIYTDNDDLIFSSSNDTKNGTHQYKYDSINASISMLLAEMGGTLSLEFKMMKNNHANEDNEVSNNFVQPIFDYILPQLSIKRKTLTDGQETNEVVDLLPSINTNTNSSTTSIALLKVVSQLLLPVQASNLDIADDNSGFDSNHARYQFYLLNDNDRYKLLVAFKEAFYSEEMDQSEQSQTNFKNRAKSPLGLKAIQLTVNIVKQTMQEKCFHNLLYNQCLEDLAEDQKNQSDEKVISSWFEKQWRQLIHMLHFFPRYLHALDRFHPEESSIILETLVAVTRYWRPECERYNTRNSDTTHSTSLTNFIAHLRQEIVTIFSTVKSKVKWKHKTITIKTSIFEQYPEYVQRQAIGLVGILSIPSKSLISGLALICSRCASSSPLYNNDYFISGRISNSIATLIFEVLHTLRKNISVQDYFTFLIHSIGIMTPQAKKTFSGIQKKNTTDVHDENKEQNHKDSMHSNSSDIILNETLFLYDDAIARTARAIIDCGSYYKSIPMLSHTLKSWLSFDVHSMKNNSEQIIFNAVKARGALAILAACSLDVSHTLPNDYLNDNEINNASIEEPIPGIWDLCATIICDLFMSSSWDFDDTKICLEKALSPIIVSDNKYIYDCYKIKIKHFF